METEVRHIFWTLTLGRWRLRGGIYVLYSGLRKMELRYIFGTLASEKWRLRWDIHI
jgi:hypothetical protein